MSHAGKHDSVTGFVGSWWIDTLVCAGGEAALDEAPRACV